MNNEGLIYINSNLKASAIKVSILRNLSSLSCSMVERYKECQDDICVEKGERELESFLLRKK